jgi:hypothetical protein
MDGLRFTKPVNGDGDDDNDDSNTIRTIDTRTLNLPSFKYGLSSVAIDDGHDYDTNSNGSGNTNDVFSRTIVLFGGCTMGGYSGDVRDCHYVVMSFYDDDDNIINNANIRSTEVVRVEANYMTPFNYCNSYLNDVTELLSRELLSITATTRSYHTATVIKYQNRKMMLVYGGIHTQGNQRTTVIQDLELMDFMTGKWYKPSSVSGEEPSPRFGHSCVNIDSNKIPRSEQRLLFTSGTNGTDLIRNGRELQDVYVLTILSSSAVDTATTTTMSSNWIWSSVKVDNPSLLPGRCHNAVQCLDKGRLLFY